MKIMNVKGGYDFLPKEQKIRNYINDTLREVFEEYGYNPIETPILCYYDILSDKYDEENDILKEIYKLTDQGDRALGLRYDLTVPFAKFIAINKNSLKMPFKRYEIAKVFRDGPVKVGRDREFTQCDVDVVGISGGLIEAELVSMYVDGFKRLGIDALIKYNSRKLMNGLILEASVKEDKLQTITTIFDKMDKVSEKEFEAMLYEEELSKKQVEELKENFKLSLKELNIKFKDTENQNIKEGLEEINILSDYIKKLGLEKSCEFVSTLARGQNYYTGNVFEAYDKEKRVTCAIGGGGRYDNMVSEFINDGENYPAVGISFGLSTIYAILKDSPMFSEKSLIDIYIVPLGTEIESLKIANNLRTLGYKVELEMKIKKIKKALDFANKEKIRYVIIIGEDELKNKIIKVKDMFESKEYELSLNNLEDVKNII